VAERRQAFLLSSTPTQLTIPARSLACWSILSLLPANSGWTNLNATGINDAGQIVGEGLINGQEQAFLMTPIAEEIPEPGALAIWGTLVSVAATRLVARGTSRKRAGTDCSPSAVFLVSVATSR